MSIRTDEIDIRVGKRIRERRLVLNVSLVRLAAKLEISDRQLVKYENAQSRVSASRLLEIARILDVSVAYFYAGQDADLIPMNTPLSGPALKLARMIDGIKDEKAKQSFISAMTNLISTFERK